MKISKVFIAEGETSRVGLKEIDLTSKKLGTVVALVGRNGAGKTRVLNLISDYFSNISSGNLLDEYIDSFPTWMIQSQESNIVAIRNNYARTGYKDGEEYLSGHSGHRSILNEVLKMLKNYGARYIKFVNNEDLKNVKDNSSENLTFEHILNGLKLSKDNSNAKPTNEFHFVNSKSTIRYLEKLTKRYALDKFKVYVNKDENEKIKEYESHKTYEIFNKYVKLFIGKDFTFKEGVNDDTGEITTRLYLNDIPFNVEMLSPGEKTLYSYALVFFAYEINKNIDLGECIIIIDEPEKHLHPGAQIQLIDALKTLVKEKGQLWIATHSINILSHLEYDQILLVKNNELLPPSTSRLEETFRELMILEEHEEELSRFVNSLSDWAFSRFIAQCFKDPDVIFESGSNDPQYQLFKKFISNRTLSILDYGAGYGRIGKTIMFDKEISSNIIYSAYEPNKALHPKLRDIENIHSIYSVTNEIPDETYDCVILSNVLHEIDVREWEENILEINRILKPNGYVIVLEDLHLPKGENANQYGYLILNGDELECLFGVEGFRDRVILTSKNEKYKDRLVFFATTREQIKTTKLDIYNSISMMNDYRYQDIKKMRNAKMQGVDNGRKYANYCQLYINSTLALEDLKKLGYDIII